MSKAQELEEAMAFLQATLDGYRGSQADALEDENPHLAECFQEMHIEPMERAMAAIRSALSASSEQQAAQQDAERDQAIGRAVQRACADLPEGCEIVIHLEKGAGTVYMTDWDGNEYDHFQSDEGFGDVINQAVDGAIAADVAARASNGGKAND